jgi:hypothetical protein
MAEITGVSMSGFSSRQTRTGKVSRVLAEINERR